MELSVPSGISIWHESALVSLAVNVAWGLSQSEPILDRLILQKKR